MSRKLFHRMHHGRKWDEFPKRDRLCHGHAFVNDLLTPRSEDDPADLTDLARWSGGMFYGVANVADGSIAARQIVDDLRHQYLLAFEPDSKLGWHRIEVRARQRATLQARSGYWVGPSTVER